VNLLLESSKHTFLGLGCFFFCCLHIVLFFFRLLFFLEFRSELAYETSKLIIRVTLLFFRWITCRSRIRSSSDGIFILYFINNLRNLTVRKVLFILFRNRFRLFLRGLWFRLLRLFFLLLYWFSWWARYFLRGSNWQLLWFSRFIKCLSHFSFGSLYSFYFICGVILHFVFFKLYSCFLFCYLTCIFNHFG